MNKVTANGANGIARACADDIGAAIQSSVVLLRLKPIFDNAALASGLCLKPVKCVIVPVNGPVDELSIGNWKSWLSSHIAG